MPAWRKQRQIYLYLNRFLKARAKFVLVKAAASDAVPYIIPDVIVM
jgi:hypothetical protein